ncbi:hypothetical protein F5B19DRAFT_91515 [Rostrohypoxylon terebratum]|nr:hypothetical protein F5B19DRAFT_91515 [Rostrohypoxylon terebratum]
MDISHEARKSLAKELAYHLSWEFWMTDHAIAAQSALTKIYPKGVIPDEPTAATGSKIWTELRSWWKKYFKERSMDTVAVGISQNGKHIVVAANIKKRTEQGIRKPAKGVFNKDEFGLHDRRHDEAIRRAFPTFPHTRGCIISVLMPKDQPQSKEQNAHLHAEMQIVNFMRNREMKIGVIGISKVACANCKEILDGCGIDHVFNENGHLTFPEGPTEGQSFDNWGDPFSQNFGTIERRRIDHVTI